MEVEVVKSKRMEVPYIAWDVRRQNNNASWYESEVEDLINVERLG